MYSDPIGIRRPLRDRLGSNFYHRSPSLSNRRWIRRQPQAMTHWNRTLHGEENHVVRKVVPKDASASNLEKDVVDCSDNTIVSATQCRKLPVRNAQTPGVVSSPEESKGRTATQKEPAAPASSEKKYTMLTVETLLQKLGLSKYLVTFKAEEIDMYALKHMNDDDLKAVGLPMGPRKKVLHAIARLRAKK